MPFAPAAVLSVRVTSDAYALPTLHRLLSFTVLCVGLLASGPCAAVACKQRHALTPGTIGPAPGIESVAFVAHDLRSGACWQTDSAGIADRHPRGPPSRCLRRLGSGSGDWVSASAAEDTHPLRRQQRG